MKCFFNAACILLLISVSAFGQQIAMDSIQDTLKDTQTVQSDLENASIVDRALNYLETNKSIYGLNNVREDLYGTEVETLQNKYSTVRFYQQYNNIPIFHGTILITFDSNLNIIWETNDLESELDLDIVPSISQEEAMSIARAGLKEFCDKPDAGTPKLYIYNPSFLDRPVLAWSVGLMCKVSSEPWRSWINAHNGQVIFSHPQRRY